MDRLLVATLNIRNLADSPGDEAPCRAADARLAFDRPAARRSHAVPVGPRGRRRARGRRVGRAWSGRGVDERRPLRLAHRGDWRVAPENTLEALLAAMRVPGCDGVEFDVRLARDGVPVLLHDATLDPRPARAAGALTVSMRRSSPATAIPRLDEVLAALPRRLDGRRAQGRRSRRGHGGRPARGPRRGSRRTRSSPRSSPRRCWR